MPETKAKGHTISTIARVNCMFGVIKINVEVRAFTFLQHTPGTLLISNPQPNRNSATALSEISQRFF